MRVWLVDEKNGGGASLLETLLRQLEGQPGTSLRVVGASPFQADCATAMRKLVPDVLDLLIVNERVWPDGPWVQEILNLGLGVVIVTTAERMERFREHATRYPITFVPPNCSVDALWLALVSAAAGRNREINWNAQFARLQQRLDDRIVIERAKGILVQRLKITEEDAYKRLRLLSRRQRRQIRDIAQSLIDTQFLLATETNGFMKLTSAEPVSELDNPHQSEG